MRRRRITKADLENKVSELMAENKYLLSMFEMTARRLDAYKKADYERKLKEPRPRHSLTIITGKKKNTMIKLFSLQEMAEDSKLPPAVVALWATDGYIPYVMREGMPLFDPVAVGTHIAKQLNELNKIDDGNNKTTATSAD